MTRYSRDSKHLPTELLVSVVVPVYNASRESFARCLDSVLSQSHITLDVIVIDDGSNVERGWLESPGLQDSRVRLVRQDNQGVSVARNTGLRLAYGEYVCFVDADDYVDESFIMSALTLAEQTAANVVFGGIRVLHRNSTVQWRSGDATASRPAIFGPEDLELVRAEILSQSPDTRHPTDQTCATNVVAALYSREVVRTVSFVEGLTQAEDRLFNVDVLGRTTVAAFCSDTWYFYDQSVSGGATRAASWATARGIAGTITAFAEVGGYASADLHESADAPDLLGRAAATGVLNYLKMLVGVLAVVPVDKPRHRLVDSVLSQSAVRRALANASVNRVQDRLFRWLSRRGHTRAMIAAGAIWVRFSSSAPKADHAREESP